MIYSVTMNPALDRTIYEDHEVLDPGGKGINVSKCLTAYGIPNLALGPVGGESGAILIRELDALGIAHDFTRIQGSTRTNIKSVDRDGHTTEANEPGPVITDEELRQIEAKVLSLAGVGDYVILSGSMPASVPSDWYAKMIGLLHEREVKVFLDTSKEALRLGMAAGPDYAKPNEEEWDYLSNHADFKGYDNGVIIISKGADGAEMIFSQETLTYAAPEVTVRSTVGAGDAMVAGFLYGMVGQGGDLSTAEKRRAVGAIAVASGSAAVMTEGTKPGPLEEVLRMAREVTLL